MNTGKLAAMLLLIAGILGLVYGSFNYPTETQEAKIGNLELTVKDSETVIIPAWLSISAMIVGAGFFMVLNRKN